MDAGRTVVTAEVNGTVVRVFDTIEDANRYAVAVYGASKGQSTSDLTENWYGSDSRKQDVKIRFSVMLLERYY